MKFLFYLAILLFFVNCSIGPNAKDQFIAKLKPSIKRVIRSHKKEIKACYDKSSKIEKKVLNGKAKIFWNIHSDGSATSASVVSDTLKDKGRTAKCIASLIETMRFPEYLENSIREITFPFVFEPGENTKLRSK